MSRRKNNEKDYCVASNGEVSQGMIDAYLSNMKNRINSQKEAMPLLGKIILTATVVAIVAGFYFYPMGTVIVLQVLFLLYFYFEC